ncbi:HNH endonuclease signature motif containing protein [Nocardioides sp. cx-173]|uniref:HNH endonuclease signature motif containing protein n=1 Tax=Nocardioides sp. cx-173 TaxID=2898796 RepID=UPI001E48207A|nr:HNH endonuclease signature motif containing protein [Nocardioides sp. cx-173]MCD4527171.1 HNH endonuclease [Nocardioides sp. cx-173]UGB40472.1 HNH endonuclease [Nocardioides sp. cx-173]
MPSTPADLLQVMRATTATAVAVELERLHAALDWCEIHATDDEDDAAFGDHGIPLAGPGAPMVSEFAVMELGAALGMSTDSAKRYVGAALEIKYRLPRIWARVEAGQLGFWKARWIAEHTRCLPLAGAAFVDARVGYCAHKVSYAEVERQITTAIARFDPEQAEKLRRQAADGRKLDVHKDDMSLEGTIEVSGTLDAQDALDLDAAISRLAADRKAAGSTESLDVRRAQAAGDLARGQDTLSLGDQDGEGGFEAPFEARELAPQDERFARTSTTEKSIKITRVIDLHVHEAGVFGDPNALVGRAGRKPVLLETIREWCGAPGTTVINVKPVRNLAEHIHVAGYEHPDRLVEQDDLVDHHCVFPWCTRPAERCDHDHVTPYNKGGPTCSYNSAPLCRGHHRLKTHGRWTYDVLDRGSYLWHSPHGHAYRRDHTGTEPLPPPPGHRRT